MITGKKAWSWGGLFESNSTSSFSLTYSSSTSVSGSSYEEVKNLPTIRGAKNQTGAGKPFPLVLGKHRFTPFYAGNPYTIISGTDGEDQYYIAMYNLGYSEIKATKFQLGELDLASNSGDVRNGFIPVDSSLWVENDAKLEISQTGVCTLYPQKVVEEQLGITLLNAEGTALKPVRFTAPNPQKVQIEITISGLLSYNDQGNKINATVGVKVEWREGEGYEWKPFAPFGNATSYDSETGTSTFTRCKPKVMRFVAERTFAYSEIMEVNGRVLELRIQRTNEQPTDGRTTDTVTLTGIRTWCFDYKKSLEDGASLIPQLPMIEKDREHCCLVTFKIKATDELNGNIDAFNCMVESCARTWDSEEEEWSASDEISPTNNPAALMLMVMQSPTMKMRAYPDSKIDLPRLGELYEFCEENGFTCNGVLSAQKKLSEVIDMILSTCRAYKILNGYKWSVLIDKPRTTPVTILNNHNIISANNQKTFDELPDGFCIGFINENNAYQEDEIYCMYVNGRELEPDAVIERIEVPFVTNPLQAWKNGKYELAKRKLRPEIWYRTVSIDGNLLSLGCLVTVQDDTICVGMGDGEIIGLKIEGNYITSVLLDSVIDVTDLEETYGLKIIQSDGISEPTIRTVAVTIPEAGSYSEFIFTEPIYKYELIVPHEGDICSFGIITKISIDALCFGISPQEDGTFELTLVPYDENVYTADQGEIPEFDSKITPPKGISILPKPPTETVTKQELIEQIEGVVSGQTPAVVNPDAPLSISPIAEEEGIRINVIHSGIGISNQIKTYTVEIQKGLDAPWIAITSTESSCFYTFSRATDGYPEAETLNTWNVRAKVTSIYDLDSVYTEVTSVNTSAYGTWLVSSPLTDIVVLDRTVILSVARQPSASGRVQYGNVKFAVQIQRLQTVDDDETVWWKPATSLNPYPAVIDGVEHNNVNNFRDGDSHEWLDINATFSQTLPLYGQAVTDSQIVNTFYRYRVKCYNIIHESEYEIVGFTVLCTNIQDLVKSNADYKELYVNKLSAISQNVGLIKQGAFGDLEGQNNHWALSNLAADPANGIPENVYEGDFRVGGRNEYIRVIPIVENGIVKDYHVEFKTTMFTVSTEASEFNGNIIVQQNGNSLDRTLITPKGTYYQHRDTINGNWQNIGYSHTNGFMSSQFFSEKTVFFTNMTMDKRRLAGYDIGAAMPSDDALVYHFDTDYYNQHQTNGLVITDAEDGTHTLAGESDSSEDIDFTPAILAIAPYATIGKSLYGQCSISGNFGNTTEEFSVDFWEQYIYSENQTMLDVGTPNERIQIKINNAECFLFGIFEDENIPMFEEMRMTRLFIQLGYSETSRMFVEGSIMFRADEGEVDMFATLIPKVPYDENGKYYIRTVVDDIEQFTLTPLTEAEYLAQLPEGVYARTCEMNTPEEGTQRINHVVNNVVTDSVTFQELGLSFEPNTWVHIGVFGDSEHIRLCIDYLYVNFNRMESSGQLNILLNQNKTSVIIDELMIDTTTAATVADFAERTQKRIPFGTLAEDENWFLLLADNPEKIKTNIFEAPQFKTAVEAILREHELID